jgi:uncharacterized repeat protein (TIGR01451 family)
VFRWLTFGVILSFLLGITIVPVPEAEAVAWQEKVDPWVLTTAPEGETEFLVFMRQQADLSGAAALKTKTAKGTYVFETLTSITEISQKPIRTSLDSLGIAYRSYWIANMLWVRGDIRIVQKMAQRPDVSHIYANPQVQISLPESDPAIKSHAPDSIEWNILKINADDVWAEGYTGQGAVIGGQDTGYDWDHPALINQYRGWDGISASHDYNWYDATGLSPNTPADPHGHGTHTMGTMVGDDGGSNQVGVAPGAKWIGCRNMNSSGVGSPETYMACYQWFVAPTRTDGSDPRPDLAPEVINNSWSCPASEGCGNLNVLLSSVQAVRAAGILTAHSAGNEGNKYPDNCGTVNQPATIYAESFSVGSTTSIDTISNFSSRGPVTVDGSNRFKPQVTAPGSDIYSTTTGGDYGTKSGTSMAAPHVAGLAALLISAQPTLSGQVDELETLIETSALPLYTTDGCGGDTSTSHPNHTYGWGRIDAWAAYQALPPGLLVDKTAPEVIVPGDVLTYTLTVTNSHPYSDTHNVILTDEIPDKVDFLSATGNYSMIDGLINWDIGDLGARASDSVEMVVGVPVTATGTITNTPYARSDEVTTPARGQSVYTLVHEPGLELSPGQSGAISDPCSPSPLLTYTHQITNTGNYTDTFDLTANSSQEWGSIDIDRFTLSSGEAALFDLEINPPCPTPPGTVDITTIAASSLTDPAVTKTITDTTTINQRWLLHLIFKDQ